MTVMPATRILLIRHAEKPDDTDGGVDPKGKPDKHDLIVRGWERAGALVQFFANPRDPNGPIKRPATIFATEPATGSESKRPLHTVTPLANFLNLAIDSTIAEGSEDALVKAASAANGVVLIAWHHEKIPAIANLILQNTTAPQKWPGDRFDVAWIFTHDAPTGPWQFAQAPQLLLAGDSPNLIK
jgi:broad specificity phosphatase PhoE